MYKPAVLHAMQDATIVRVLVGGPIGPGDRLLLLFPDADERARVLRVFSALPSDQRDSLLSFDNTAVQKALEQLVAELESEKGAHQCVLASNSVMTSTRGQFATQLVCLYTSLERVCSSGMRTVRHTGATATNPLCRRVSCQRLFPLTSCVEQTCC